MPCIEGLDERDELFENSMVYIKQERNCETGLSARRSMS